MGLDAQSPPRWWDLVIGIDFYIGLIFENFPLKIFERLFFKKRYEAKNYAVPATQFKLLNSFWILV